MATIFQMPGAFPPEAAALIARRLLNKHSAHEIAEAVEVLIDVLDLIGGDPDAEDDDPSEAAGDEQDAAFTEWQTRGRHKLAGGKSEPFDHAGEDAEDDDPDSCAAADDIGSGASLLHGSDGLPGDAADAEIEDGL